MYLKKGVEKQLNFVLHYSTQCANLYPLKPTVF